MLLLFAGCGSSESTSKEATGAATASPIRPERIAILIGQADDPYSQAIREGITVASQEFDLQLEWMDTPGNDSRQQAEMLQKAVDERFRAVCVAPMEASQLLAPLEAAAEAGIPVVALEKPLPSNISLVSFVSTDHFHLGRIVAQHVSQELKAGKILLLNGSDDDAAATRRQGFQYALTNGLTGLTAVDVNCQESVLTALWEAFQQHDDVKAVVALDAPCAAAAVRLVADKQLTVKVYGFGAWPGIQTDIQQERLAASVLEDPYITGYSAMMALSTYFHGGENLEFIMPEPMIVTAGNLNQENIKRLLESNMGPLTR